jgi:hypothetical protein
MLVPYAALPITVRIAVRIGVTAYGVVGSRSMVEHDTEPIYAAMRSTRFRQYAVSVSIRDAGV